MGINLAEIQQKVDRLLYNMAEQNRRAYSLFFDPNPQEVELPQLDENGNLITVKIPNRALIKKQLWDDIGGAIGQWRKTLYVDPEAGDDNNLGTENAPFKTIGKANSSIPLGGVADIYLSNSAIHEVSGIGVDNKIILFRCWDKKGDGSPVTVRKSNWVGFILNKSHLYFVDKFKLENPYDPNNPVHWNSMFKFICSRGLSSVSLGHWTIDGSDVIQIRADAPLFDVEWTKAVITLYNCDIDELGEDSTLSRPLSLVHYTGGNADTFVTSCTVSQNIAL